MEKQLKAWIARDESYMIYESYHDYQDNEYGLRHIGDLHLFFDSPEYTGCVQGGEFIDENGEKCWRDDHCIFENARECCSIPSYMFPEIKDGECYLVSIDKKLNIE